MDIQAVDLVVLTEDEALEVAQADADNDDYNPFDDNGGDSDGPAYLAEAEAIASLGFTDKVSGYRLRGYTQAMRQAFEDAGISTWLGNDAQCFAYFLASPTELASLKKALEQIA